MGAATGGGPVSELLGSGAAATPTQTFKLKQSPLTYTQAPTSTGSASSLQVQVNGAAWTLVPTLYNQPPTAQVFTVTNPSSGGAVVGFGGYPTIPPVLAGAWRGVPTIIHDANAVIGRAKTGQAFGIGIALREEERRIGENVLEKAAGGATPEFRAAERAIGNARIDENDGNVAATRFAQKIRPDFGLHHDHQRGANRAKGAAHRRVPIQRKVKYAVSEVEALAREALARVRGR